VLGHPNPLTEGGTGRPGLEALVDPGLPGYPLCSLRTVVHRSRTET